MYVALFRAKSIDDIMIQTEILIAIAMVFVITTAYDGLILLLTVVRAVHLTRSTKSSIIQQMVRDGKRLFFHSCMILKLNIITLCSGSIYFGSVVLDNHVVYGF